MAGVNCWEHKKCGRQRGGPKVAELGICPVTTAAWANGVHGGSQGGRACWVVAGTLCGGKVQGVFAQKMANCMACDFYKAVRSEEGRSFRQAGDLLRLAP